jgi:hypothetical protein
MSRLPILVLGLILGLLLSVTASSALAQKPEGKATLAPGKNVPGPFHPFNVTGPFKGRYHCLVSEYDADPVVLLFARGLNDNAAFRDLLQKLDSAIERNPSARLRCFVVFLADDLPSPIDDDDKREGAAAAVEKLGADLKHVVLCLGSRADAKKYEVQDDSAFTALLYKRLFMESIHLAPADKVDEALEKTILGEVSSKLGAKR